MPVNGIIARYDKLRLWMKLPYTAAGGTTGLSIDATLASLYTPDALDVVVGLSIRFQADESGGYTVTYHGPNEPFAGVVVSGSGVPSGLDMYVVFNNYRLYGTLDAKWHVFVDSIDIISGGSTVATLGGFDVVSDALGPTWVPIFCGMVSMAGGANCGNGSVSWTLQGGYEWQIGGTWYSAPTKVPPPGIDAPTSGPTPYSPFHVFSAPFNLTLGGSIVSTSTSGDQIQGTITRSGSDLNVETVDASLILVPDLPKSIVRLNSADDFGGDWYRFAVPLVQSDSGRQFSKSQPGPAESYYVPTTAITTVFNRESPARVEVGPVAGAFEDFFADHSYLICALQHAKAVTSGPDADIVDSEGLGTSYPSFVDDETTAAIAPYMDHADINARYFNSAVVHPHWSVFWWTLDWGVNQGPGGWDDYWGLIREQYLATQLIRNHIVSDPLTSSGYAPFLAAFCANLAWIGVSRPQVVNVTPPTSMMLDSASADAWSVIDTSCTLAFGSGVTITPAASVCKFRLDLQRFDCPPFFYAMVAKSVLFNWAGTNIASVKVYAESSGGTTAELFRIHPSDTTTAADHTYPMPRVLDEKYAGDWAFDNGAGAATDTGADLLPAGFSSTIDGDVGRMMAFGLLAGKQPAYIRFEVTVDDTGIDAVVDYPVFNAATARSLFWLNGQIAAILYANGPGVRLGNHIWYDGAFVDPPEYSGLGYKGSILDAECDWRILFLGIAPDDGLDTANTVLFDTFEGQSRGEVDRDGIYYIFPPDPGNPHSSTHNFGLINTWGETPPLAAFGQFGRSLATWQPDAATSFAQRSWVEAHKNRLLISNGMNAGQIVAPDTTTVWSTPASGFPAGWSGAKHAHQVDNTESPDFIVRRGGVDYSNLTPWHGWFWIGPFTNASGAIAYDVSPSMRHARGLPIDGTLNLGFSRNQLPLSFADGDTGLACDWARIVWLRGARSCPLYVLYGVSGTIYLNITKDEGQTYEGAVTVGTGTQGDCCSYKSQILAYWLDGDTINYTVYDAVGNVVTTGATNVSGVDDMPIACDCSVTGGEFRVHLFFTTGGTQTVLSAKDLATFS